MDQWPCLSRRYLNRGFINVTWRTIVCILAANVNTSSASMLLLDTVIVSPLLEHPAIVNKANVNKIKSNLLSHHITYEVEHSIL